jgi:hypothetical protein
VQQHEPAIALAAGLVLLHQVPRAWSLLGVAFVVAAGIGAERTGARPPAFSGDEKSFAAIGSDSHAGVAGGDFDGNRPGGGSQEHSAVH